MKKSELKAIAKTINFEGAVTENGLFTNFDEMAKTFAEKFNLPQPVRIEQAVANIFQNGGTVNMTDSPENVKEYAKWEMQRVFSFLINCKNGAFSEYYRRDKKRLENLIKICK